MGYSKSKILKQSKELVVKHKLFFVEDIIAYLPCCKATFYNLIKTGSPERQEIDELLEEQRVVVKTALRAKWYKSDNATLQLSLMKIICTDDERKKLSMTHNVLEGGGKPIQIDFRD